MVRTGVRALLSSQSNFQVCGEAIDGVDAIEKAKGLRPDLIVMDISMPRLNGLEATRQIRNILPQTAVVMLSQHDSGEMVRQAVKAGALGYVVKSSIATDLLAALERASRQQSFLHFESGTLNANLDAQEILQRSAALERALRESEELYRSTFERAALGVAQVSPDGRWLRVNPKFCEMVAYTKTELLKLKVSDIAHPEELNDHNAQFEKLVAEFTDGFARETRFVRKDGSFSWVNLSVSSVRDAHREVKYLVCVMEDINERKRLEEAVRQNEKQLRDQLELKIRERTAELERKNSKLEQQTQLVRDLSGHLMKSQDDERRRIARELHDSVGQLLAAMGMNSSTVVREKDKLTPKAGKCVEENIELAAQVLSEIRTMSHLLHPPLLDEIGLNSALKWYVEGFVERSKIDVRLEISPDLGRLAPDVEISLFRIVQECLINVHRHSESASASVRVSRSPREVTLEVKDNGKGITPEALARITQNRSSGVGLRGMRERIRQLAGRFDIESNGAGVSVTAVLPLEIQVS